MFRPWPNSRFERHSALQVFNNLQMVCCCGHKLEFLDYLRAGGRQTLCPVSSGASAKEQGINNFRARLRRVCDCCTNSSRRCYSWGGTYSNPSPHNPLLLDDGRAPAPFSEMSATEQLRSAFTHALHPTRPGSSALRHCPKASRPGQMSMPATTASSLPSHRSFCLR